MYICLYVCMYASVCVCASVSVSASVSVQYVSVLVCQSVSLSSDGEKLPFAKLLQCVYHFQLQFRFPGASASLMLCCAQPCQCVLSQAVANPQSRGIAPNRPTFAQCQQCGLDHTNPALLRPWVFTTFMWDWVLAMIWGKFSDLVFQTCSSHAFCTDFLWHRALTTVSCNIAPSSSTSAPKPQLALTSSCRHSSARFCTLFVENFLSPGSLECWNATPGILEPESLEPSIPKTLGHWKHASLGPWNLATLEPCPVHWRGLDAWMFGNPWPWNSRTLALWNSWNLQPSVLELRSLRTLRRRALEPCNLEPWNLLATFGTFSGKVGSLESPGTLEPWSPKWKNLEAWNQKTAHAILEPGKLERWNRQSPELCNCGTPKKSWLLATLDPCDLGWTPKAWKALPWNLATL